MVGATASGATVGCPECGAALRVAFADGGATVDCHRCGEAVRVPARPHPVETAADAGPVLTPAVARRAARGVRLLQLSLALFALEHALVVATLAVWFRLAGPAAVANRDLGGFGPLLALVAGLDLGLLTARTTLRWVGYRRCEPAAAAVGVESLVAWARWAPVVRLAGYVGTFGPWAAGASDLRLLVPLASVVWSVGAVLEFGAVAAWGKLLAALGDRYAAGRAARYFALVAVAGAVLTVGLVLARVAAVMAVRRLNPNPPHPVSANLADLPADAWPAYIGLAVVAAGLTGVLCLHYARLLAAVRDRLTDGGR